MIRSSLLIACLLALARSQSTEVSQCLNHQGELPIHVNIEGCAIPPCNFPQLQDAIVNLVFRVPRTMRTMRTLGTAYMSIIGSIAIPIPYDLGEHAETCNFLQNTYCPVIEGEVVMYQLRMYIESIFPVGTQVAIEFRIVDEFSQPFVCLRVVIRITEPEGTRANSTLIDADVI